MLAVDELEVIRLFEHFGWQRRPGLADPDIGMLETDLGVAFPADLRAFLHWSNGGQDFLGEAYIRIHSAEEMREFNGDDFREFFPSLVRVGGNGGLEGFCLDYRNDQAHPTMVSIDLNNIDTDSYWPLATTFTQAMRRLSVEGDPQPPAHTPDHPHASS